MFWDINKEKDQALKNGLEMLNKWTTGSTLYDLGLQFDEMSESEKRALCRIASNFERRAKNVGSNYMARLRLSGVEFLVAHHHWRGAGVNIIPEKQFFSSVNLERDYGETYHGLGDFPIITSKEDLIVGLFLDIGKHLTDDLSSISRFASRAIYASAAEFCQAWERPLGWKMNEQFVREFYTYLAACCRLSSSTKQDSETTKFVPNVDDFPSELIYFAYGSNMNRAQMAQRCPGAEPIGVATILNFKFYINSSGVAGIKPSLGKVCNGILWCLKNEHWPVLDYYEGVQAGHYSKIQINCLIENQVLNSSIYVANDLSSGTARPGYLEGVIDGAKRFNASEAWLQNLN